MVRARVRAGSVDPARCRPEHVGESPEVKHLRFVPIIVVIAAATVLGTLDDTDVPARPLTTTEPSASRTVTPGRADASRRVRAETARTDDRPAGRDVGGDGRSIWLGTCAVCHG